MLNRSMSAVSAPSRTRNPIKPQLSYTRSIQRSRLSSSFFEISNAPWRAAKARCNCVRQARWRSNGGFSVTAATKTFDVVVVGAGIIGLSIARQFLRYSDLSVAVVDASLPCSGATGAGQGHIWMVHRMPGYDTWDLAVRSHGLWRKLADDLQDEGVDPLAELGWMKTGSLLVGKSRKESDMLKKRVEQLSAAGVRAEYLSVHDLIHKEPELEIGSEGSAAFLPDDAQLDAHRAVNFIEEGNRISESQGRYAEFFHDPAESFISSRDMSRIKGVKTKSNTLYSKKALVVAAGCWTGSLMHNLTGSSDVVNVPVQPRKGCLLEIKNFSSFKLKHGLMESGYMSHLTTSLQSTSTAPGVADRQSVMSISMTATTDANGSLLLGSSRQFAGFSTELDMGVVRAIWDRAAEFFPTLRELPLEDLGENQKVRIGLRPYMPDGRPVIGPIPQMPDVYIAAGHEGSGLALALGTAEMVVDMVMDNPLKVDPAPFAAKGRCC